MEELARVYCTCGWQQETALATVFAELHLRCVKLTSIDTTCIISLLNPMFDHLLELSQWDDSNKWSNMGLETK